MRSICRRVTTVPFRRIRIATRVNPLIRQPICQFSSEDSDNRQDRERKLKQDRDDRKDRKSERESTQSHHGCTIDPFNIDQLHHCSHSQEVVDVTKVKGNAFYST